MDIVWCLCAFLVLICSNANCNSQNVQITSYRPQDYKLAGVSLLITLFGPSKTYIWFSYRFLKVFANPHSSCK